MLLRLVTAGLLLGLAAGCGGNAGASGGAGTPDTTEDREAAVYAAVLRHHLTETGKGHDWSTVFVMDRAVKQAADPAAGSERSVDGRLIAAGVRERVVRDIQDLAPVRFIGDAGAVRSKDGCRMRDPDAILVTFGPVPASVDKVSVGFHGWQGCMAGTWLTYVVVRDGDRWRVDGTTGPVGIS